MKKTTFNTFKFVAMIPFVLLAPLILLISLLGIGFVLLSVFSEVQRYQIRNDIFSYIQENSGNITLNDQENYQYYFYASTGFQDGSIEYGYYYSPDDAYIHCGEPYREGYRTYGIPDDETDWYYTERICENLFYCEIHDG